MKPADSQHKLRHKLHEVIFEADTPVGKAFDVALILAILLSVAVVILDSVEAVHTHHGHKLEVAEWVFTILFTVEYALRLYSVRRPILYARSFFGIVDFLSIVPTYLSVFLTGMHALLIIRVLRMLRLFRVFKLARYVSEAGVLSTALRASQPKITVFLLVVFTIVIVAGAVMHFIEGPEHGFTSIPKSMYWAVVTMTTVGYGDIIPQTVPGQIIASFLMILGYGIIAVPTGIISAELATAKGQIVSTQACPNCGTEGHDFQALYCKKCGARL